jgi:hypothetical protein
MKELAVMLVLVTLSFGQMPLSKGQKRDCSNATKALKKNGANPNQTLDDFRALLAAVHQACGTPEDYAAAHQPSAAQEQPGAHNNEAPAQESQPTTPVSDAQRQECSEAKEAIKKNGTDPNLASKDLSALLANLQQACGTPDNSQPAPDIRKVLADCSKALTAFDKNITAPNLPMDEFNALSAAVQRDCRTRPGAHDTQTAAAQDSQAAPDIRQVVAQSMTSLNQQIALGNRLISHLQSAQTWEGIDADHPDAVALREKIAEEEKELRDAIVASAALKDKRNVHRMAAECTKEELDQWVRLTKETVSVLNEVKTQQERYHALGY